MDANLRRIPRQARSRLTVDFIVEAAARIIVAEGWESFSTNAVATLAGISVGSLYEYFSGKEAILVEFARREIKAHESAIIGVLASISRDNYARLSERLVEALLSVSDRRIPARRAARQMLVSMKLGQELADSLNTICRYVVKNSTRIFANKQRVPNVQSLFIATRAVSGVISAAIEENIDLNGSVELRRELVTLIDRLFEPSPIGRNRSLIRKQRIQS